MYEILATIYIFVGGLWLIVTYKSTQKIDINFIFYLSHKEGVKVINEAKFIRLQKAKYYINRIGFILIGVIGLRRYPMLYELCFIPIIVGLILSLLAKKYITTGD